LAEDDNYEDFCANPNNEDKFTDYFRQTTCRFTSTYVDAEFCACNPLNSACTSLCTVGTDCRPPSGSGTSIECAYYENDVLVGEDLCDCDSEGEMPPGYGGGGGGFDVIYGNCIDGRCIQGTEYDACNPEGNCVSVKSPCAYENCRRWGIPDNACPGLYRTIGCGTSNFLPDESTNQTLLNVKIILNNEEVCIPILCDTGCDEYELCEES
jgi:hypothetical protein